MTILVVLFTFVLNTTAQNSVVHDAEHYIIKSQNEEKWTAEDREVDQKLAELKRKHGQTPNIVYILWDDQQFGAVGFPGMQRSWDMQHPISTKWPQRALTLPECTPSRPVHLREQRF